MIFGRYIVSTVIILCMIVSSATCVMCEDNNKRPIFVVQGKIASLDTVGGVMVVEYLQGDSVVPTDQMVLKIPEDLSIMKGTDTIGIEDLNQFDTITAQCRSSGPSEPPVVVGMTVALSD